MGRDDLETIVAHTKFDFFKVEKEKTVVKDGEVCNRLIMMTNGRMESLTTAFDHSYSVVERMDAPYVIQPQYLFGLTQRFRSTFTATDDCNFISINKMEIVILFDNFDVFRINFLNQLATTAQKSLAFPWRHQEDSTRKHITEFIFSHCQHPAGHKTFYILMEQLAKEINASRLEVSAALNEMQDEGLIELRRGRFIIPYLEKL